MKKQSLICLLAIVCVGSTLTACGKSENNKQASNITPFEIDVSTVSNKDIQWNIGEVVENNTETTPIEQEYSPFDNMGELKLEGQDTSQKYKTDESGNVIYGGVTYANMLNVLNQVSCKYDTNTLINFLIKKYNAQSTLIYVTLEGSGGTDSGDASGVEDFTFDSELEGYTKYDVLKAQYGEPVTWRICLKDSVTRTETSLYGCLSYVIMPGIGSDLTVDMTELDPEQ